MRATRRAEHPPQLESHPQDCLLPWGAAAVFTCQTSGYPEPRLVFQRNGRALGDNENCSIEYLGHGQWECRVRSVTEREAGRWGVVAENTLGSSSRDWWLRVGAREEEESSGGEYDEEEEEEEDGSEKLTEEEDELPDMSVISGDLHTVTPALVRLVVIFIWQ